jgi:hypothetical protein
MTNNSISEILEMKQKPVVEELEKSLTKPGEIVVSKLRKPRLGFEITQAQEESLKKFIPWGNLTSLYQAITDDLVELFEKHGSAKIISAIISRKVHFHEISKTFDEYSKSNKELI